MRIVVTQRERLDLEIVIPALDEEQRIQPTLRAIIGYLERQSYRSAVVVVDNGCLDGTVDVVAEIRKTSPTVVSLINCSRRGKGAAVRQGILTSRARYVGFCDADLATPIEVLDRIWPLLEQGVPIVIGSRRCDGAVYAHRQPWARRLSGWGFRAVASRVMPDVTDTQCGFKFFDGETARALFSRCTVDGFAFDLQILTMARAMGVPIREVPVTWSDVDGSTVRAVRDGISIIGDLLTIARNRVSPSPELPRVQGES
jgi:dolichyl-phosphate beta-glucosyltransferase